MTYLDGTLNRW